MTRGRICTALSGNCAHNGHACGGAGPARLPDHRRRRVALLILDKAVDPVVSLDPVRSISVCLVTVDPVGRTMDRLILDKVGQHGCANGRAWTVLCVCPTGSTIGADSCRPYPG